MAAFKLFKLSEQPLQLCSHLQAAPGAARSGRAGATPGSVLASPAGGCGDVLRRCPAPFEAAAALQPLGVLGVKLPKGASARLPLLSGHLDEAFVDAQVVPDGALDVKENKPRG